MTGNVTEYGSAVSFDYNVDAAVPIVTHQYLLVDGNLEHVFYDEQGRIFRPTNDVWINTVASHQAIISLERTDFLHVYEASTSLLNSIEGLQGLCCTNPARDSSCEASVVAAVHGQTHTVNLQDQELAGLQ